MINFCNLNVLFNSHIPSHHTSSHHPYRFASCFVDVSAPLEFLLCWVWIQQYSVANILEWWVLACIIYLMHLHCCNIILHVTCCIYFTLQLKSLWCQPIIYLYQIQTWLLYCCVEPTGRLIQNCHCIKLSLLLEYCEYLFLNDRGRCYLICEALTSHYLNFTFFFFSFTQIHYAKTKIVKRRTSFSCTRDCRVHEHTWWWSSCAEPTTRLSIE